VRRMRLRFALLSPADRPPRRRILRSNRVTYSPEVFLFDDLLAGVTLRAGAAVKVRNVLIQDVTSRPSFAAVAKALKTPSRTLRRHLQLQSTSYRQLSDELRTLVALQYLRDTKMTNEDIAFALGFSDAANFRHAFRRWTGKAPNDYRRQSNEAPNSRPHAGAVV
jgi:AraC-like DNA-binding protein